MKQISMSIFTFNELHNISVRFSEIIESLKNDVFIAKSLKPLNEQFDMQVEVLAKSPDLQLTKLTAEKDHVGDKAFETLRDQQRLLRHDKTQMLPMPAYICDEYKLKSVDIISPYT